MTNDTAGAAKARASAVQLQYVEKRQATIQEIAAGRLPTIAELDSGCGFASGSWENDLKLWIKDQLLRSDLAPHVEECLEHLQAAQTIHALRALYEASTTESDDDFRDRIDYYLSGLRDHDARARLVVRLLWSNWGSPGAEHVVLAVALARDPGCLERRAFSLRDAEGVLLRTADTIALFRDAEDQLANPEQSAELEAVLLAVAEDRAEIGTDNDEEEEPLTPGHVVVPALPAGTTNWRKEIARSWAGVAGNPLPVVVVDDVVGVLDEVRRQMPHASEVAVRVGMYLQPGKPLHLPPIMLVGSPGCGKTTFWRLLAKALGLPFESHNFAGAADASIMGTSAQWSTARESSFLQQIKRERIANPMALLDELEKASLNRNNGSALEGILPVLEQHTACRFRDPALEVDVDLSMVNIVATANSLQGIPSPVLDRFTVMKFPEPEFQHIGVLSRGILDRIAKERGLDPRWLPDLAGDETEALQTVWNGGSIRRLDKALRLLVERRDALLPRA